MSDSSDDEAMSLVSTSNESVVTPFSILSEAETSRGALVQCKYDFMFGEQDKLRSVIGATVVEAFVKSVNISKKLKLPAPLHIQLFGSKSLVGSIGSDMSIVFPINTVTTVVEIPRNQWTIDLAVKVTLQATSCPIKHEKEEEIESLATSRSKRRKPRERRVKTAMLERRAHVQVPRSCVEKTIPLELYFEEAGLLVSLTLTLMTSTSGLADELPQTSVTAGKWTRMLAYERSEQQKLSEDSFSFQYLTPVAVERPKTRHVATGGLNLLNLVALSAQARKAAVFADEIRRKRAALQTPLSSSTSESRRRSPSPSDSSTTGSISQSSDTLFHNESPVDLSTPAEANAKGTLPMRVTRPEKLHKERVCLLVGIQLTSLSVCKASSKIKGQEKRVFQFYFAIRSSHGMTTTRRELFNTGQAVTSVNHLHICHAGEAVCQTGARDFVDVVPANLRTLSINLIDWSDGATLCTWVKEVFADGVQCFDLVFDENESYLQMQLAFNCDYSWSPLEQLEHDEFLTDIYSTFDVTDTLSSQDSDMDYEDRFSPEAPATRHAVKGTQTFLKLRNNSIQTDPPKVGRRLQKSFVAAQTQTKHANDVASFAQFDESPGDESEAAHSAKNDSDKLRERLDRDAEALRTKSESKNAASLSVATQTEKSVAAQTESYEEEWRPRHLDWERQSKEICQVAQKSLSHVHDLRKEVDSFSRALNKSLIGFPFETPKFRQALSTLTVPSSSTASSQNPRPFEQSVLAEKRPRKPPRLRLQLTTPGPEKSTHTSNSGELIVLPSSSDSSSS